MKKVAIIVGLCLTLTGNLYAPAYARRVMYSEANRMFSNISQRLQALVGEESAGLIADLIKYDVSEEIRNEIMSFACEILEDARRETDGEIQNSEFEDAWVTIYSFLSELVPNIEEADIDRLASMPGFDRMCSLLEHVVPALVNNLSISTTSDDSWDFKTAFGIIKNKYYGLRANLISIQNRSVHNKNIVTTGVNIAFRVLFPKSISESSSEEELTNHLDAAIEGISRAVEKEDEYVDTVTKNIVPKLEVEAEENTKIFIESFIEAIRDFNQTIIDLFNVARIKIDGKDYLRIGFPWSSGNELDILAEYSEDESGSKKINRILVASNPDYKEASSPFGLTYVDIDSLGNTDMINEFRSKIEDLINSEGFKRRLSWLSLYERPEDGFLATNFDFEDLKRLLTESGIVYAGKPLLLFLLSQELKLTLLNGIDTYTLTRPIADRRIAGAYLKSSGRIIFVQKKFESIYSVTHEIAHSRFQWWMDNNKSRIEGVIGYFEEAHPHFFNNIDKHDAYNHLGDDYLGKLNELIAYLTEALVREYEVFRSFDENGDIVVKAIISEDIERLADLGFVPDWAGPSKLGYTEETIDSNYYRLLFKHYVANCDQPTLFSRAIFQPD